MMRRARGLLGGLFLFVCLAPSVVAAGAWTQPPGAGYMKLWLHTLVGGFAYIEGQPAAPTDGLYTDFSLNAYLEYGVTRELTLIAMGRPLGYAAFQRDGRGDGTAYSGAMGGGLRWGFPTGPVKWALEGHYMYAPPVGERRVGGGLLKDGRRWFYQPTTSTHRLDLEAQVGVGFSLGQGRTGWFSASAGLRYQSRAALGSAIVGMAQLGVKFPSRWVLDFHINLYLPLTEITTFNISGAGNTRYVGFGLTTSYWFAPSWALTAALEGVFIAYANAATPTLIFGLEAAFGGEG